MKLTIYLIRDSVVDFESVIPARLREGISAYVPLEHSRELGFPCQAYVQANKPSPPKWTPWLASAFDVNVLDLQNQSNSFVLLLKAGGRIFAVSFGYGFNAVDRSLVEADFGLKVTLNEVNPKELDTLDTRTIDRVTRQRRTHLNVGQPVDEFDISVDVDWIRSVSGKPVTTALAKKLAGSDSLKITWEATIEKLGEHCEKLLEIYRKDTYRSSFGFIDHLRPIKSSDPAIPVLEDKLQKLLQSRDDTMIAVAYPEIPDERIEEWVLRHGRARASCQELDIREVYRFFDENRDVSVDAHKVRVLGIDAEEGALTQKATLHRYLVAQVEHDGATYILSLDQWFKTDTDYVKRIRERVREITSASASLQASLALPKWMRNQKEDAYNKMAGGLKNWLILDRDIFTVGDRYAKIEVCDLLTPDREFIHVKDMKDSATLSHLFAQGCVSAELLKLVPDHESGVKGRFEDHYGVGKYDAATSPRVVYGIATPKPGDLADSLFFFSVVNLLQHVDRIRLAGFNVALCRIEKE